MKDISLIVIDPQIGFCSSAGSLGAFYGEAELNEIKQAIPNIQAALQQSRRRHLVLSEYSSAQFTGGDRQHPLANLCVPHNNNDCQLVGALSTTDFHSVTVKHQQSALSCRDFLPTMVSDLDQGIQHFALAGFLIEYCVQATAKDLYAELSAMGAEIIVCRDLVASRAEKYRNATVDAAFADLARIGIRVQSWQSTK